MTPSKTVETDIISGLYHFAHEMLNTTILVVLHKIIDNSERSGWKNLEKQPPCTLNQELSMSPTCPHMVSYWIKCYAQFPEHRQ